MFNVMINTSPMIAGETRSLRVDGAIDPIKVEIRCFTTTPPPAGFKPCPECGSYTIQSGQDFDFSASASTFGWSSSQGDELEVLVRDATGNSQFFKIQVGIIQNIPSEVMVEAY